MNMRKVLPAAATLILTFTIQAAGEQDGRIISRSTYAFPGYEKAAETGDVEKYASSAEYAEAVSDSRFILEKVRYQSDGLEVVAYLYRPEPAGEAKLPAIVFNRGSYVRDDIAPELVPLFRRLAAAGFIVIAPLYRQSEGTEGRDEMGGADLADLMNVVPLAEHIGSVDMSAMFLYGESRGGMMVFQAVRDGFPAKAAATFGAFTDLEGMVSSEGGKAMAKQIWPDFASRRSEIIERRSALQWPEKLNTPLLLMHGSADRSVPVTDTLRLATALAGQDQPFGVIVFPGGNHTLRNHARERDQQAVEFFRKQME